MLVFCASLRVKQPCEKNISFILQYTKSGHHLSQQRQACRSPNPSEPVAVSHKYSVHKCRNDPTSTTTGIETGRKPHGAMVSIKLGSFSILIWMAQVLEVVDGGACWGQLQKGDSITHVNSVSVVGKEPQDAQAVFESSCTSLGKVVLQVVRPCKGILYFFARW